MNSLDLFELAKNLQVASIRDRMFLKNMSDSTKRTAWVNLVKIHLLLLKLIVVKEISSWMMKVLH
jgi:hypothetical protein